MLQDLAPHVYRNEISWKAPESDDLALAFGEDRTLLCRMEGDRIILPRMADIPAGTAQYAFSIDGRAYYLVPVPEEPPDGFLHTKTSALRAQTDHTSVELFAAAAGESLWRWYRANRFCGRCGVQMEPSKTERAMVCPACAETVYPKICPAVIAAVTDGDRLLLTRYANRPFRKYALVAGFAEIGETIEDTVRREVFEETGLHVKNLRFYKSQPWVFTDTLLMGFFCELDGSADVTLQTSELAEARWFSRAEIPADHSNISLTGEMIERFRRNLERSEP